MVKKPLDWSKALQTHDGRKVLLWDRVAALSSGLTNVNWTRIGVIFNVDGTEKLGTWAEDGSWGCGTDARDLVNVPERIERVVYYPLPGRVESNLFHGGTGFRVKFTYEDGNLISKEIVA